MKRARIEKLSGICLNKGFDGYVAGYKRKGSRNLGYCYKFAKPRSNRHIACTRIGHIAYQPASLKGRIRVKVGKKYVSCGKPSSKVYLTRAELR